MTTQIATWFVADEPDQASFFPQIGARSDLPESQAIYWRCATVFFASSLAVNPDRPHLLYTNAALPVVDGVDLALLFDRWGVRIVRLPITRRLATPAEAGWGNQFYVFDVLRHYVFEQGDDQLVLLDSDCLWLRPVDALSQAISHHGALTLPMGEDDHPEGQPINGITREQLARFAGNFGSLDRSRIEYCGGEILAVDRPTGARILDHFDTMWPTVMAEAPCAPREEAHLLSAIYSLERIAMGTAEPFIRRMWTTFRHNNLRPQDEILSIWHLPAEKRTGFADLFRSIAAHANLDPRTDTREMGLTFASYASCMGWPRRRPRKFVRDLGLKLRERLS